MMENATMKKSQLVLSLALASSLMLLSACQTIRSHNPFRHREPDYKSAQQENPLEVPPGLDNPPNSEALTKTRDHVGWEPLLKRPSPLRVFRAGILARMRCRYPATS